ncbi:FmdB family zinc ribbon protein [Paradesulfitobacterium ferrireducens]|uniref:FmdB family zinc ribbon protein n=1 Tax=Paradesulfitobacterium ferrireducens TaxID=2816476 RepID=UPI001A8CCEAA|nr:zinc ribbon domain-containing protein [Paradesulfitobacterium ferrireducens]
MPIYEFKCPRCGQTFNKLCRLGESGDSLVCPGCGQVGLCRKISGFTAPGVAGGKSCASDCSRCSGCR